MWFRRSNSFTILFRQEEAKMHLCVGMCAVHILSCHGGCVMSWLFEIFFMIVFRKLNSWKKTAFVAVIHFLADLSLLVFVFFYYNLILVLLYHWRFVYAFIYLYAIETLGRVENSSSTLPVLLKHFCFGLLCKLWCLIFCGRQCKVKC